MSGEPSQPHRLLKAAIFAMALLAVGGIAGIAITGIERVNLGAGRKSFHSAWLVEFHWPAMLLFLLLLAGAILGTAWLCRRAPSAKPPGPP
jgi:H+/Cl- antiporter ClcA